MVEVTGFAPLWDATAENPRNGVLFHKHHGKPERLRNLLDRCEPRWQLKLTLMKFLTPGDFATVKRQCIALDTQLSAEEWLDQLQIECDIKNAPRRVRPQH